MSNDGSNQNVANPLEALKNLYTYISPTGDFSVRASEVNSALRKISGKVDQQRELMKQLSRNKAEEAAREQSAASDNTLTPVEGMASAPAMDSAEAVSDGAVSGSEKKSAASKEQDAKPAAASTVSEKPKTQTPSIRTQIINNSPGLKKPSYVKGTADINVYQNYDRRNQKSTTARPQGQSGAYPRSGNAPYSPTPGTTRTYVPRQPQAGSTGYRPQGGTGYRPQGGNIGALPTMQPPGKSRTSTTKGREPSRPNYDDKKSMNKRTLIRKGFIQQDMDEDRIRIRKMRNKKRQDFSAIEPRIIDNIVITSNQVSIKMLSEMMGVSANDIMKKMLVMGGNPVKSINEFVDFETLYLVADEFNITLTLKLEQTKEEAAEALHDEIDDEKDLAVRPPIIAVMGHVDHGKTSLLDAIRKTNVVYGEAGGITQHIGAYTVKWEYEKNMRSMTFLDTPGHEAFTEMRARGAKFTDIVVLVVAADDGVQPQTLEAISHVRAAGVPMIVAINKIDKADANVEKIKQELSSRNVLTTEWGGDVTMVPISAKQNIGIDNLLQEILFLADVNGYKANPNRQAKGAVVEARLDKGKGPVATVIVQNGTLRLGDAVVTGKTYGKIRAMTDSHGNMVKEAPPSMPVSVLGLNEVPNAGDIILVVQDEKTARQIVGERGDKTKNEMLLSMSTSTLDDALRLQQNEQKDLAVIIKADVQGSAEALRNVLIKKENEEVRVSIIHSGVGAINKSDVMLAEVTGALIVGFNVKPDSESKNMAEKSGIRIAMSNIIYDLIDEVDARMNGMIEPKYKDTVIGHAEVRNIFKITGTGIVAGSYVLDGKIQRGAKAIVRRKGEIVYEGTVSGLKHFKDDAKEMSAGFECGIFLDGFTGFELLDQIEAILSERIN